MGKNLKLNIKNLQLAGAFKIKKPAQTEGEAAAPPKKDVSPPEGEPKKRLTRLKEDASVASALKQAEKTLAARGQVQEPVELSKKKKTRIIQGPGQEERPLDTEAAPAAAAPQVEEESAEPSAPAPTASPPLPTKPPVPEAQQPLPSKIATPSHASQAPPPAYKAEGSSERAQTQEKGRGSHIRLERQARTSRYR